MHFRTGSLVATQLLFALHVNAQDVRTKTVDEELLQAANEISGSISERTSAITNLDQKIQDQCDAALLALEAISKAQDEKERRKEYKAASKQVSKCNRALIKQEQKSYRDSLKDDDFKRLSLDGVARIRARVKALRGTSVDQAALDEVLKQLDQAVVKLADGDPRAAFGQIETTRDRLQEAEDAAAL